MKIAVASGKGGTGKSTVSTNLAWLLSQTYKKVCLLDCDVEEPNCHIFLKPYFSFSEPVDVSVPQINVEKCIQCGKCAEVCQYNSLAFVKGKVIVFPELCHGCGSCGLICPSSAITETGREVGVVEAGTAFGFNFIHGKSRIGEAMSPPLIKAVKAKADEEDFNLQILDCPPGTSCPVITAVSGADFVIMVTEPTPFGLYDLRLAVDVITGDLFVGMDIGRKKDLSVIWIIELLGNVKYTRMIKEMERTPFHIQEEVLSNILKHRNLRRCCIDSTGLGMQLAETAQRKFGQYRVEPITFTNKVKEEMAYNLRTNFEDKTVYIPGEHEIREDLHSVRRITTSAGNMRFDVEKSEASGHADRFWALALALHAAGSNSGPIHISTRRKRQSYEITKNY